MTNDNYWESVLRRDAGMDGAFFYAVISTGVYCRPSCSARRPKRDNVLFFQHSEEAERAGFRACLRCRPQAQSGPNPHAELAGRICRYIEAHLEEPITLA